jgi:hypothetical protein
MPGSIDSSFVLATVSKHDIGGIIAIVVGIVVVVFGLMRAAIRAAMLVLGVVVVLIGVLLLTRTI